MTVRARIIQQNKYPWMYSKKCSWCKKQKTLETFHRRKLKSGLFGWQHICKPCATLKSQKYKETARISSKAWRKRFKEAIQQLKESKPCTDCGNKYPYYVMQFDHLPGSDKKFNIGTAVGKEKKQDIFDEIDKCELVCSNCHAIRTHQRKQI